MKKKFFAILFLLTYALTKAQLVVDNTTFTPQQLAQNVLLGQGVNISNIRFNRSTSGTIRDQIALFDNGSTTNIGINKGLILSTGNAIIAKGPNDRTLATLPTSNAVSGDPDLLLMSNNLPIRNVSILEFDFIPVGDKLTFNFVFASEEYPEFVNDDYNDQFGFFISGPGITGPYSGNAKNIALIPTTALPVSINNLNNGTSNSGPCEYCQFYVNNENGASIQYDGFTKVIQASSDVECGQTYHIKMAIANIKDNNYDSAVFIEGASFRASSIDLGKDLKICSSSSHILDTGLDPSVIHEWTYNGAILPETGPKLTVTNSGIYGVKANPIGLGCPVTDEIKVDFSAVATPNISCGLKTPTSITFDWSALGDASFSISYQIENNTPVNVGSIGKTYSYTVNNVLVGQDVSITVTPIGSPADCYTSSTFSCNLDVCVTTPTLNLNSGPFYQQVCQDHSIEDIEYVFGGGATSASITSGSLPTGVTANLNGNTFTISGIPTSIGTFNYTITTSGGCGGNAAVNGTIVVNSKINPSFAAIAPICEGTTFTLPTQSNNGISGTWSPAPNNTATTQYTFTPDSGECANTTTLSVAVIQKTTSTFSINTSICEGTVFTLPTQSNNGISGTWSPAPNNTATTLYTFTPNSGECANTETVTVIVIQKTTPIFSINTSICEGTIFTLPAQSNNGITGTWSPAPNNNATTQYTFTPDSGQCANTETVTVTVIPKTTPTFNINTSICEGTVFTLPTQSNNGITGTWSPATNNTTTTQYTFTPDSEQCANTETVTINVVQKITPTFSFNTSICEGTVFTLPTISNNGISGTWSPAPNNTATTQYTFTPDSGECAVPATIDIVVNSKTTPTFNTIAPICQGDNFSLPTISNNGISGTWSPAPNNTATTEYTFTPNSTECSNNFTLTVVVNTKTIPTFNIISPICEGEVFSLPQQSNNGITGTWSPAINNQQTTEYTFTPDNQQCAETANVSVVVTSKPEIKIQDGKICIENATNNVIQPYTLDTQLSNSLYTFEWFLDGNKIPNESSNTLEVRQAGHYGVLAIDKNSGCYSDIFEANVTSVYTNSGTITFTQSESFSENSIITITVSEISGLFEYQLDNSYFQTSNQFSNITPGKHIINVRNTDGCVNLQKEIFVIGYPKFFTPNGDGQNDYWNIISSEEFENDKIFIFDRYGKLIKQFSSKTLGWDGTYNGKQMPATDYWFKILFKENNIEKEFKSHFSLKR